MYQPQLHPLPFSAPSAAFNLSNLSLFLFAIILNVFFCSVSVIVSQFVIRDKVPSVFTTIGPR